MLNKKQILSFIFSPLNPIKIPTAKHLKLFYKVISPNLVKIVMKRRQ
jgi:hypothetical protein